MGGFGSGRWKKHRKKGAVESCRTLTAAVLIGDRPPRAGQTGRLEWRDRDDRVVASVGFAFVTDRRVTLVYAAGEEGTPVTLPLDLEAVPTPHGGTHYLAHCPLVVNGVPCRQRAAKLYLPPGSNLFGCRHCHRLAYRSSQRHDPRVSALLTGGPERLFKLAASSAGLPVAVRGRILFALKEWQRRGERMLDRLAPRPPPRRRKTS